MKSKLYTRGGDNGTTSLVGGTRVAKDSERLAAYGTIDELNSWIGLLASSELLSDHRRHQLIAIQNRLFEIGSILSTEPESSWQPSPFPAEAVTEIEKVIDEIDGGLEPLRNFILPGGCTWAAQAHIARTVARRAERNMVTLARSITLAPEPMRYINRLSDMLFALAREFNHRAGVKDTPYKF